MRKIVVLAVVACLLLVGCGQKTKERRRDAPTTKRRNVAPAEIIEMPDGFSNLAHKCDGPNMVYVTYHGDGSYAAVSVVPNDKRCLK